MIYRDASGRWHDSDGRFTSGPDGVRTDAEWQRVVGLINWDIIRTEVAIDGMSAELREAANRLNNFYMHTEWTELL